MKFFIGPFLEWFPFVVLWGVFLLAFLRYALEGTHGEGFAQKVSFQVLAWWAVGVRIFYAGLLSIGQYYVWSGDPFTKQFLASPLTSAPVPLFKELPWIFGSKWGYFIVYVGERFWLGALVSIFVAWLFYLFLKILKRHNGRFFKEGEIELGLLMALLVGWPSQVLLIPLIFLSVVFVSLVRLVVFYEKYTTLGWPFLLAAFVMLGWGSALIVLLHLTALKI